MAVLRTIAGRCAASVNAEIGVERTIILRDAFGLWKRRAHTSAALFIAAALVILCTRISTERIDACALVGAIPVGLAGLRRTFRALPRFADLVLLAVAVSSAGTFGLAAA